MALCRSGYKSQAQSDSRHRTGSLLKAVENSLDISGRNPAATISHLDDGVGRVMQTLQELGLDDDTIVLFTADHGISMGRNGVWGVAPYAFPAVGNRQCFR